MTSFSSALNDDDRDHRYRPPPAVASMALGEPVAPYLDAVMAYAFRGAARYHVPGHKGGRGADPGVVKAIGIDALAADVPQLIYGIDVGPSPTPYERAEAMAAEAFGAARRWFLSNVATQGNHALCLALAPLGGRVVVQRNSYGSVVDGLVLSGGLPSFVVPEYDEELGITHCVTPETLPTALRATPDARAAFVVSPTYYGMAADIVGLAEIAHDAGLSLVVDQAWGRHFGFHEDLPATALSQGADAMLTSTHKIAGSLTQSAMLHVAHGGRVNADAVARALRLVRTTSLLSLLLESLDGARRQLVLHGEQLLCETLEAIAVARAKLLTIEGIRLLDASLVGRPGISGYDPLRMVVDVRGTGCTGYEVADALRRSYDVHVELPAQATIVFVVGLGESTAALRRLAGDIEETVKRIAKPGRTAAIVGPTKMLLGEMAVPPREAFLGEAEQVPVSEAVERISCEAIASYPPGVPQLLPGERISAEIVTHLSTLAATGDRRQAARRERPQVRDEPRPAGGELIDVSATRRKRGARLAGVCLIAAVAVGVGACGSTHTALSGPAVSGSKLTIYSSLPLQGATAGQAEGIVNGAKLALQDAGSKVGKYTIGYVSLDDSTAATGATSNAAVARNAQRAVGDASTIAYLGEFNSGATEVSLPILNRAGIAQVSPSNTYVGLTTNKPGSLPGEPGKFYPTGKRTFARIVPADDVQGAALAVVAKRAGCKTIEIWNSGTAYSAGLARNLELAAGKAVATLPGPVGQRAPAPAHALRIVGNVRINPTASSYAALAQGITASCFVFTGELESGAAQVYKDVAAAHPGIKMFGGDATVANALASPTTGLPASIANHWQGTFPTLAPATLGAAGKKFVDEYDRAYNTTSPDPYAIYGYEAMALALSTIKSVANAHNGQVSRTDVINALLHTQNRHSAIGTYSINADGDTTLAAYGLYGIAGGRLVFGKVLDTRKL